MNPRRALTAVAAAMLVSLPAATLPALAAGQNPVGHTRPAPSYSAPENLGAPITSVAALDTAYGTENGRPVMYTTTNGSPSRFQVVDLSSNTLLRSLPLPDTSSSWSHTVDASGRVVVASSGKLFRYTPGATEIEDLGAVPGAVALYGVSSDAEDNLYVGTYPDARVVRLDAATGEFRDYGTVKEGQEYVRSMTYHEGTVYAGTGSTGSLWAIDAATGEKNEIPFPARPEYDPSAMPQIYGMNMVGDLLFVHVLGSTSLLMAYDTATGQWSDTVVPGYRGLYTSPERDGQTWFVANGRVQAFDLTTHQVIDTGIAFGTYLRHSAWVDVSAENPDLPGLSLVTIQYGGAVTYMNPATTRLVVRPAVVEGQPVALQSLGTGPDGAIYSSGYMGTAGARYLPGTGRTENFPLGQAEGMTVRDDSMVFGLYPGATVRELDTTAPLGSSNPRQVHDIGENQDRPFAMTAGDGYTFLGTVADYGHLDGALTIHDGESWTTYPGIVDDQSVIGLAYSDGVVYGSTSIWGGLGSQPTQTEAHVFAVDVATGEKTVDVVPDLPGDMPAKAIGSLSFGPDGLLWGAAYGTIFAMDPATLEVVKSREIVPTDWGFSHLWRPTYLEWAHGQLYTTLGYSLIVVDPVSLRSETLVEDAPLLAVGEDGHLYYSAGTNLMRIRVDGDSRPAQSAPRPR